MQLPTSCHLSIEQEATRFYERQLSLAASRSNSITELKGGTSSAAPPFGSNHRKSLEYNTSTSSNKNYNSLHTLMLNNSHNNIVNRSKVNRKVILPKIMFYEQEGTHSEAGGAKASHSSAEKPPHKSMLVN